MVDWFRRPAAPKAGEHFTKGAAGGSKPPQEPKQNNNHNGSGGWTTEYQKFLPRERPLK